MTAFNLSVSIRCQSCRRLVDVLGSERRYFNVVRRHINVGIRRRNDAVWRRYRQLPIDHDAIIENKWENTCIDKG